MLSFLEQITRRKINRTMKKQHTKIPKGHRTSVGEEITRQVFEEIYGEKFPSIRPDWLCNPATNKNMELDGYNETLKIAFEYQGKQHYELIPLFHTKKMFNKQQQRDNLKRILCEDYGVLLVSIPCYIKHHDLKAFIKTKICK
jgi:hypothetical protein